jgi:S1-C subfamily serine protease
MFWGEFDKNRKGTWKKVINAPARSGDSGGPVLNERGEFVGTLWGAADGDTYYTPVEEIEKLLLRYYND